MKNVKEYYESLEQRSEELSKEYTKLDAESETNFDTYFTKGKTKIEAEAAKDKCVHLYNTILSRIPEDKKNEVNEYLKPLYFTSEYKKKSFELYNRKKLKEGQLEYEYFTLSALSGKKSEIIEKLCSYLPEKEVENIIKENEEYVSHHIKKVKIKMLDDKITKAKKYVEANETDNNKKKEILEELDLINELVVGTNKEFQSTIDGLDREYESGRNKVNSKEVDDYIKQHNPESNKFLIRETFDYSRIDNNKLLNNVEEFRKHKDTVKITMSEQNKKSTLTVLKAIEEMGIYSPADNGNEQGTKIYGFRQIYDAHNAILKALENNDFSNLKTLRENYAKSIENMNKLFDLTKKAFNPGPRNMVGNLSNLRENYVPYNFVEDISTNATVSSLYNMYTIIKRVGCTPEEFVEDPYKFLNEFRELRKATDFNIDYRTQGMNLAQSLSFPIYVQFNGGPNDSYGPYALPRVLEGIRNRESDPDMRAEIGYNAMFCNSFDMLISSYSSGVRDEQSYMANHYLNTNPIGTIANALLVNEEDRVMSKIRAHEHYDPKDELTIIKPFDIKEYLTTHSINAVDFKNKIIDTTKEMYTIAQEKIAEYTKLNQEGQFVHKEPKAVNDYFSKYMEGAQKAIQMYLLLNNPSLSNKGIADENGIADLVEMLKDPTKMFGGIELTEKTLEDINEIKNGDKILNDAKKSNEKSFKKLVAEERKAESIFNKEAIKLYKSIYINPEKYSKDYISDAPQKFFKLIKIEKNRLEKLYQNDKIPKDYYENRIKSIENNEFDKKVPFLDDGIPSKNDYIKSTGLEALTKEEMDGLYQSFKLRIEREKQIFMNNQYLIEKKYVNAKKDVSPEKLEPVQKPKVEARVEQPQKVKISVNLDDETEIQTQTKIDDVAKQKTIEKTDEVKM